MKKLSRRPDGYSWMMWYPNDWIADNGLTLCTAESRGVWIEILNRMWQSQIRGVLTGNITELSRLTRCTVDEVTRAVADLESHHVFVRGAKVSGSLPHDAIVCRRMFRDFSKNHARAEACRANGSRGGAARWSQPVQTELPSDAQPAPMDTHPDEDTPAVDNTPATEDTPAPIAGGRNSALNEIIERLAERSPSVVGVGWAEETADKLAAIRGVEWRPWFQRNLTHYIASGGDACDIEEIIRTVADAGSALARRSKDVGELKEPGKFVVSRLQELLRARKITWPKYPEEPAAESEPDDWA